MDLHYGGDDFSTRDRLDRTLSRDRAKDMASDYEQTDPAQSDAERRGITFRERVVEIVRRFVPEKLGDRIGGLLDGLRSPEDVKRGQDRGRGPGSENVGALSADVGAAPQTAAPVRGTQRDTDVSVDGEAVLRSGRTKALGRHARALDTILHSGNSDGQGSPDQMHELIDARSAFEKVRPYGWRDAEAADVKNPELVREASAGRVNRVVLALQLKTEIRIGLDTDPGRRADRFVESWQRLDRKSQHQCQAGDMSGYKSTHGHVRYGQEPRTRFRSLNPCWQTANASLASTWIRVVAWARNSPSAMASAEGGHQDLRLADLPPFPHRRRLRRQTSLPPAWVRPVCPRRNQQEQVSAGKLCPSRIVSYAPKPSLPGPARPVQPSIARSPKARSRPRSRSVSVAPDGPNPMSIDGR